MLFWKKRNPMELEEFQTAIRSGKPHSIVAKYVLERIPALFADDWDLYRKWRLELSRQLEVDQCNVAITGSACSGYSLSPYKGLKPFNESSDIDIAIVSDYYFTVAWRTLRGLRPHQLTNPRERQSLEDHRSRYVYYGCIATDRILRLLPFAKQWILARDYICSIYPTEGREINFRIYRDFDSLRSYQESGIRNLQRHLLENYDGTKIS